MSIDQVTKQYLDNIDEFFHDQNLDWNIYIDEYSSSSINKMIFIRPTQLRVRIYYHLEDDTCENMLLDIESDGCGVEDHLDYADKNVDKYTDKIIEIIKSTYHYQYAIGQQTTQWDRKSKSKKNQNYRLSKNLLMKSIV